MEDTFLCGLLRPPTAPLGTPRPLLPLGCGGGGGGGKHGGISDTDKEDDSGLVLCPLCWGSHDEDERRGR